LDSATNLYKRGFIYDAVVAWGKTKAVRWKQRNRMPVWHRDAPARYDISMGKYKTKISYVTG
jgi:hypothetical protein